MTPEEQQQVYAANRAEALSAQRNEEANKGAHWFAMYMVEKTRADAADAKVKELTPKPETKLEVVPAGDAA